MSTNKPEKFRLNIVGADEDVPRLLLAYGRGCGGEAALVFRPRDNTAILVHQVKKQPARVWRTDLGLAPSHAPELEAAPADAVAELKRLKASPPPAGPATLKGKWAGYLHCDDGKPRVTLERRVASYGLLKLASGPDGRWTATFERLGKWFSVAKAESAQRGALAEAITAGMGLVVGLVSEACSFRDTRRRNAVDADYAALHPARPASPPKDPTERYRARSSFRAVEQADGWVVVNDVGAVVAKFGRREKGKAARHASALTRGKGPGGGGWVRYLHPSSDDGDLVEQYDEVTAPSPALRAVLAELPGGEGLAADSTVARLTAPWDGWPAGSILVAPSEGTEIFLHPPVEGPASRVAAPVADAFGLRGMPGLAVVPALADVPAPESPSCAASVATIAASTEKEAEALEGYADSLWGTTEVPELLTRAAKLLRHAEALVKSPLCTGKEKKMAWEDLRRGAEAYTQARDAFVRGEKPDIVTTLRRIAERVSLAAARAAKSCGAGQQKLGKAPRSADQVAEGITRRESPPVLMPTVPMQPVWPPAAPPIAVPTAEKPKRSRKAKESAVDPAKDKLLVDAFADAIKQAAAQMGGAS